MKGKHIDYNNIDLYTELNIGFRIITAYSTGHDQVITRLDIKIGNEQYFVAFCCGQPIEPQSGYEFKPLDDLITPKNGIISCINLKVNKDNIVNALKELVSDIEGRETPNVNKA